MHILTRCTRCMHMLLRAPPACWPHQPLALPQASLAWGMSAWRNTQAARAFTKLAQRPSPVPSPLKGLLSPVVAGRRRCALAQAMCRLEGLVRGAKAWGVARQHWQGCRLGQGLDALEEHAHRASRAQAGALKGGGHWQRNRCRRGWRAWVTGLSCVGHCEVEEFMRCREMGKATRRWQVPAHPTPQHTPPPAHLTPVSPVPPHGRLLHLLCPPTAASSSPLPPLQAALRQGPGPRDSVGRLPPQHAILRGRLGCSGGLGHQEGQGGGTRAPAAMHGRRCMWGSPAAVILALRLKQALSRPVALGSGLASGFCPLKQAGETQDQWS